MAASIPVLRVLFKEVKSSARKYYNGSDDYSHKSQIGNNTVIVSANKVLPPGRTLSTSRRIKPVKSDDCSERGILPEELGPENGIIIRTDEITLRYHDRKTSDENNEGYEMDKLKGRGNFI
jgi:hypothetical protein